MTSHDAPHYPIHYYPVGYYSLLYCSPHYVTNMKRKIARLEQQLARARTQKDIKDMTDLEIYREFERYSIRIRDMVNELRARRRKQERAK